ncbi:GGDEF domain-containing protein [Nocardia sp. NPDC051030]|uniref:GGDEF domain-containing protein n=1 Tax=Nocardia sp. NPDC051030 TaxID=3155162 RepID=UPI0034229C10
MIEKQSMFRAWWRDRVDYRWLVETFESHGALGRFKFMLGAGGIVMLSIALLAMVAQHELTGVTGLVQGLVEAAVAGIWTIRWWFLPWPREGESLVWLALFDIDVMLNDVLVHDRVIGVLGLVLLVAMGAYVTVFHTARILALHVAWSLVAAGLLAWRLYSGGLGGHESADHDHRVENLALAVSIVLVVFVVVGVMLPFMQFSHWLLREDALTDPLTKLLNRRGLDSRVSTHFQHCRNRQAYVATLDLDRFKAVNDTHGHAFGDEALVRTAECLCAAVDSDALVARTGGEEFVVIGRPRESAAAIGERLRHAVETQSRLPLTITASIGIVVFDASEPNSRSVTATYQDLLRDADSAMYRAKRLGGNTVVIAEATEQIGAAVGW